MRKIFSINKFSVDFSIYFARYKIFVCIQNVLYDSMCILFELVNSIDWTNKILLCWVQRMKNLVIFLSRRPNNYSNDFKSWSFMSAAIWLGRFHYAQQNFNKADCNFMIPFHIVRETSNGNMFQVNFNSDDGWLHPGDKAKNIHKHIQFHVKPITNIWCMTSYTWEVRLFAKREEVNQTTFDISQFHLLPPSKRKTVSLLLIGADAATKSSYEYDATNK